VDKDFMKKLLTCFALLSLVSCDNNKTTDSMNPHTNESDHNMNYQMHSDNDITKNLTKSLSNDSSLSTNARTTHVSTSNGVVTLNGTVNSAAERDKVVQIAQMTPGVKSVRNNLTIKK